MTDYVIRIIVNGEDRASGALGSAGSALGNMATIAGGILSAQLFQNIARGIMDMGREALDATALWERMGLAMQSMIAREMVNTGAAKDLTSAMAAAGPKAEELLHWIEGLAIQSPFDAEGVAATYRQALTFGFASDEAKKLTQTLIDMSAGMGLSSYDMQRVSYALGQINQSDKLLMQDLRQLMNAGVPVNDILKKMGYTLRDVGKKAINSKAFIAAFTEEMGGGFENAAAKQSKSWAGLLNSISDIKKIGLREFFSSTFEKIQPLIGRFVDKFSDPAYIENLRKWGEPLGRLAGGVVALVENFDRMRGMFSGFSMKPFGLDGFLDNAKEAGVNFAAFWKNNGEKITKVFSDLGKKLAGQFGPALSDIVEFLGEKFNEVSAWFLANGPLITDFLGVAGEGLAWLGAALADSWEVIKPILGGLIDLILGLAKVVMQAATGDWKGAWETMKQTAGKVWDALKAAFWAFVDWIAKRMGGSLEEIKTTWSNNWEQFREILGKVWNIIVQYVTDTLANILLSIALWLINLKIKWQTAWNDFLNIIRVAWSNIKNTITTKIAEIRDAIYTKVGSFVDAGWQIVAGIEQGITAAWRGLISKFKGLIDMLPEEVKKILGISSPSKVFAGLGANMMEGLAEGIRKSANIPIRATAAVSVATAAGAQAAASTTHYWNVTINHPAQTESAVRDDIRLIQLMAGAA